MARGAGVPHASRGDTRLIDRLGYRQRRPRPTGWSRRCMQTPINACSSGVHGRRDRHGIDRFCPAHSLRHRLRRNRHCSTSDWARCIVLRRTRPTIPRRGRASSARRLPCRVSWAAQSDEPPLRPRSSRPMRSSCGSAAAFAQTHEHRG